MQPAIAKEKSSIADRHFRCQEMRNGNSNRNGERLVTMRLSPILLLIFPILYKNDNDNLKDTR